MNGVAVPAAQASLPEPYEKISKQHDGTPIVIVCNRALDLTEEKKGEAQAVEPDGASKVFADKAQQQRLVLCIADPKSCPV